MIRSAARDRRRTLCVAAVAALLICLFGAAGALSAASSVVIGKGSIGSRHWGVVASADGIGRKGICFQVGVYQRTPRSGVNESGQCSAPAARRGIVLTVHQRNSRTGLPAITVIGAAFNKAVERVETVSYNGESELLHLRQPKVGQNGAQRVGQFRYVALAVQGPWCVERLITYDAQERELWVAEFNEDGERKTYEYPKRKAEPMCPRG